MYFNFFFGNTFGHYVFNKSKSEAMTSSSTLLLNEFFTYSLEALAQLLIESFLCQPMHEFVYCVASTMILYAQGNREIFQPEKFLDRTGNRTRRLRIGNSVPLPTRLSETPAFCWFSGQFQLPSINNGVANHG